MSTLAQAAGNSLQRQLERTARFAAEHGLELDSELSGQDIGISAFKGLNATAGNLGRILEAINDGRIAPGSWLIVESLDRLSRQDAFTAFPLFAAIINAGVTIATTSGHGQIYSKKGDQSQLWLLLGEMIRANDESRIKQDRGLANWKIKRAKASEIKLTANGPGWLRLSPDRKTFEVIEERAEIVRRIFRNAINGMGVYVTADELNREGVPTFGKSDGWHQSTIMKILTNRAVLGEFQLHSRDQNNKQKPEGPPIQNYFPAIIDAETFEIARLRREERANSGRGRKGAALSNLFSGLLKCGECGRNVLYENKGVGPKGGRYLVCQGVRRKLDCPNGRWRYQDFETSFLSFVSEIDLGAVFSQEHDAAERRGLQSRIDALHGELLQAQKDQEAAFALHRQGISIEFIGQKLAECQTRIDQAQKRLDEFRTALTRHDEKARAYYDNSDRLQSLIAAIRSTNGEGVYEKRAMLAARLRTLIDHVRVYAAKNASFSGLDSEIMDLSHFDAIFKNGKGRLVYPDPRDPTKFAQQYVGEDEEARLIYPDGRSVPLTDD